MKKKKLFKNYNFEFDKNDRKIIKNFCKQAVSQMQGDEKFYRDVNVFNSILEKVDADTEEVKLTKDETTRLTLQIRENVKHLKSKVDKSNIFTRWLYNSAYKEYNKLLTTHFSG
ncbi:hypothetical protein ACFLTH_01480 [Bacteroidota bacterium]